MKRWRIATAVILALAVIAGVVVSRFFETRAHEAPLRKRSADVMSTASAASSVPSTADLGSQPASKPAAGAPERVAAVGGAERPALPARLPRREYDSSTSSFARLFAKLQLDAAIQRKLWDLLRKKDEAGRAFVRGMENKTFPSLAAATESYDLKSAEVDVDIRALLTPEQYTEFRETEEKLPVRNMEAAFGDNLWVKQRVALDRTTREALVDLIYSSYKTNGVELHYNPQTWWVEREWLLNYLQKRERADQEVYFAAAPLLTPEERAIFRDYQVQQVKGIAAFWNHRNPIPGR